jgi:hypothetical protein
MPGAVDIGIEHVLLDWVLSVRPDLLEPIRAALGSVQPADHEAVVLAVVAGYYHDATVRSLLGYPGQEARPVRTLDYPEYLSEGLLDFLVP